MLARCSAISRIRGLGLIARKAFLAPQEAKPDRFPSISHVAGGGKREGMTKISEAERGERESGRQRETERQRRRGRERQRERGRERQREAEREREAVRETERQRQRER